jgi:hypothetical protein
MSSIKERANVLEDMHVPVKLRLAASWAALMFLYAYGDIFSYFRPGFIEDVMAGEVFAFEINQLFLLAISIYVAIPAAMVFLSLVLKPRFNRWANIVLGAVYGATILLSTIGENYVYYVFLSVVEAAFAALIVWYAWMWPKQSLASVSSSSSSVDR